VTCDGIAASIARLGVYPQRLDDQAPSKNTSRACFLPLHVFTACNTAIAFMDKAKINYFILEIFLRVSALILK